MILSTKEMLVGLEVSHVSLYGWIKAGLPVIKQSPYLFDEKSLKWVIKNKESFKVLAKKMMEG